MTNSKRDDNIKHGIPVFQEQQKAGYGGYYERSAKMTNARPLLFLCLRKAIRRYSGWKRMR